MVHRPRLQLFGPLRLLAADGADVTPRGQKARGLLALLALARDGRLARIAAASRLWSGSHDAKANLRQCLRELRRALDAAEPGLLRSDDYELTLDRERLAIDALSLDQAHAGQVAALEAFDDDCLLRDCEITDPLFEEWLTPERVRWRDRLYQALETAARARLGADDPAGAIRLAARLVAFDPTLEAAHRILMQGHAAQGNASLALRQFELCRDSLKSELGVAPGEATLALRAAIARPPQRSQPSSPMLAQALREPRPTARPCAAQPEGTRRVRIGLAAFRVLSTEPSDTLYAVILGEAIGAALARSGDLTVIDETTPPTAAPFGFADIAALPSACIVDGSVARLDGALRLSVRLSSATDRRLLWAEHFRLATPAAADALDRLVSLVTTRLEEAARRRGAEVATPVVQMPSCGTCEWRLGVTPLQPAGAAPEIRADEPEPGFPALAGRTGSQPGEAIGAVPQTGGCDMSRRDRAGSGKPVQLAGRSRIKEQ